jgi:putative transposase
MTMTKHDPKKHHRQSIRLRGYDYTQAGAYFVTIVTHGRELLFDDPMLCRVAETMWQRIPRHFPGVELDEWVVMPNHIHGILVLTADPPRRGEASGGTSSASQPPTSAVTGSVDEPVTADASPLHVTDPPRGVTPGSLGAIVGNFKSVTARRINRARHMPGAPVWQRNYYERVIRNERELAAVRQYIRGNPAHWAEDVENPDESTA